MSLIRMRWNRKDDSVPVLIRMWMHHGSRDTMRNAIDGLVAEGRILSYWDAWWLFGHKFVLRFKIEHQDAVMRAILKAWPEDK